MFYSSIEEMEGGSAMNSSSGGGSFGGSGSDTTVRAACLTIGLRKEVEESHELE